MRGRATLGMLVVLAGGCAITSKGEPLQPRYFAPEVGAQPAQPVPAESVELALGTVRASAHLRQRIVYRKSPNEIGYYEARRWAERPEEYLRRAVARSLFEQRSISRVQRGPAPILELELVAFEEVREPAHAARIQVAYRLFDTRGTSVEDTILVEVPIPGRGQDPALAIVNALGQALDEAVETISQRVVARLTTAGEGSDEVTVLRQSVAP